MIISYDLDDPDKLYTSQDFYKDLTEDLTEIKVCFEKNNVILLQMV